MSVKFVSPLGLPVAESDQAENLGQIYFNTTTKKVRVYKTSGWADVGGSAAGSSGKPGMITNWAGSYTNVPTGWLLCDGEAVSRTTYADLFAVIGTNHGAGNGTTTFNLPNYLTYWLVGAPSSLSTAPNPSGLPASWVSTTGTEFYGSFSHSTDGAHSSHAASLTPAGAHSHTGSHTHSTTSGTSGSGGDGNHTVDGVFNFAGSAHTHSITSGANSAEANIFFTSGVSASGGGHTHVISLASAANSSNHVVTTTSYSGPASHTSHTHTGASATSDAAGSPGSNADHSHTLSALSSSGGHAHATHDPKRQTMYYIIKT